MATYDYTSWLSPELRSEPETYSDMQGSVIRNAQDSALLMQQLAEQQARATGPQAPQLTGAQDLVAQAGTDPFGKIGSEYLPGADSRTQIEGLRAQEDAQRQALMEGAQGGLDQAALRAQATEAQLREAGMLGLADQFRRAQRSIAFDAARRGTLGGSRSLERTQDADTAFQAGVGQVAANAAQSAASQFQQESAPFRGVQQQAQQSPFSAIGADIAMRDIQNRGQGAGGEFGLQQQRTAVQDQYDQTIGGLVGGGLSSIAGGIRSGIGG